MKTSKIIFILTISGIAILSGFGCDDSQDEIQTQLDSVKFDIVVLDDEGNEGMIFDAGTDVTLALKLTNQSNEDFLWDLLNNCELMLLEDFYTLYKIDNNEEQNGDRIVTIGKPYVVPDGCLSINLPPVKYSPGTTIFLEIPWSNNSNTPLGRGKYFSTLTHIQRIDNDRSIFLDLRVDFEIQ